MKTLLIFLVFFFSLSQALFAQSSIHNQSSAYKAEWAWSTVNWNSQDQSYRQARQSIDTQLISGHSAASLTRKFDQPNQLNDTLVQFKWAYASYELSRSNQFRGGELQAIKERLLFGARQKPPHSQEFVRLLFLVHSRLGPFENLANTGQSLVKAFPHDFEVMGFALQCLNPGVHLSHLPNALTYAKDLKRQQPDKPESLYLLANVYEKVWYSSWDRKDAQNIVSEYRRIIRVNPNNKSIREYALRKINWVQKTQPILEKKMHLRPRRSKT